MNDEENEGGPRNKPEKPAVRINSSIKRMVYSKRSNANQKPQKKTMAVFDI